MPASASTEHLDELGTLIREARGSTSQDALAEKLGVAQSHLSALETGTVGLSPGLMLKLEKELGIDVSALVRAVAARKARLQKPAHSASHDS